MTNSRDYSAPRWPRRRPAFFVLALLSTLAACSSPSPARRDTDQDSVVARAIATPTGAAQAAQAELVPKDVPRLPNDQLLALALDQRTAGEYDPMAATLAQIEQQGLEPALQREVQFHQGEAELLAGRFDAAVQRLGELAAAGERDKWRDRAQFLLALAHERAGRHADAVAAYVRYRELNTLLAPYAAQRKAAQEQALGDTAAMIADYEYAAAQPIAPERRVEMLEMLIRTYGELGRSDLALARFRDLLVLARKPEYRPDVLLRGARLAGAQGATADQGSWLRAIVDEHPRSGEALAALDDLAQLGAPAPPYTAGRIRFWHDQLSAAIAQFDAALAGELSEADRFEARRLRALALRGTGAFDEALSELGALATGQPVTAEQRQAELDYIQTVGHSGNRDWAIEGYRRYADTYPDDPLASEALWRAVQLQQAADEEGAMQAALDLGRRYGRSEQARLALDRAAYWYYRQNRPGDAVAAWQLLGASATGSVAAEARFWAGALLLEQGQRDQGYAALRAAVAAAPETYYATRSRELLGEQTNGAAPLGSALTRPEREAVEDWLAGLTGRPAVRVDDGWLPEIAASPEVLRARELGVLGLRDEARDEWFAARALWNDDPERLWQLALLASIENEPYVALKLAERIVELSPAKRIVPDTPAPLLRLVFPAPYARLARQYTQEAGFDPRLLYSVLRQESLFNPDATSWVGARGLAQVMPATGEGIAANLELAGYHPDMLYKPAVSLRFGAFYFGRQLEAFDGSIQAAASAYNGGPGNAARWLELSNDPDRFTELIDFGETRNYVKYVYGNWGMYRTLYAN